MKQSAAIDILRPPPEVYDLVSNPRQASVWNPAILGVETITSGPWAPGSQTIWILNFGGDKLEMIETAIECSRPERIASTYEFIRFLPPTPAEISEKGMPRINYEYELGEKFHTMFGKYRPSGLTVIELFPRDDNATFLRITDELQIGGIAGFTHRMAILFRRQPLKKLIKSMKITIESEQPEGTE